MMVELPLGPLRFFPSRTDWEAAAYALRAPPPPPAPAAVSSVALATMHYSNHRRKLTRFDCDTIAQQLLMQCLAQL